MNNILNLVILELLKQGYIYVTNSEGRFANVFDIIAWNSEEIKLIKLYSVNHYENALKDTPIGYEIGKEIEILLNNFNIIKTTENMSKEVWLYISRFQRFEIFKFKGSF